MRQNRILIVEADDSAQPLRTRLIGEGWRNSAQQVVRTADEAVEALQTAQVDAVIVNHDLLDAEGLEPLRRIKTAAGFSALIVVADDGDEAISSGALKLGAAEVFTGDAARGDFFSRTVARLVDRQRADKQHRDLERLFETMPDAVLVVSEHGVVRFVNEAALELFGRRREDFIDERLGFSVGDGATVEFAVPRRDGERVCEMRVVPMDWDGERAYLAALRDVTERRRIEDALRASERRLRYSETHFAAAQRIAEVGSFVKDLTTGSLNGTPQFYRIFGLQPSSPSVWNEYWTEAVSADVRALIERHTDSAKHGERPAPLEFEFVRRDGARRIGLRDSDVVLDSSGAPIALLGVVRDVTDLKIAEARSKVINQELEARVTARTAQLEAANKELEAFTYSVSHDLRAPLRAIDGFSRILQRDHAANLSEEALHCLTTVRASTLKMSHLIDDLLAYSRIGQHGLRRVTVDMQALVAEVVSDIQSLEPERCVQVEVGPLPAIKADPALVRLIIQNLVENAFKYTRKRKQAKIEISSAPDEIHGSPAVAFHVRDNGVGFDMRFTSKLFGIFQRLHAAEDYEGTGVGLAVVHRIVQRHEGRITATAQPGRGACFTFALPVNPGVDDTEAAADSMLSSSGGAAA